MIKIMCSFSLKCKAVVCFIKKQFFYKTEGIFL